VQSVLCGWCCLGYAFSLLVPTVWWWWWLGSFWKSVTVAQQLQEPATSAWHCEGSICKCEAVIVSWWTSFSVCQLLVCCKRLNETGRRIVVCWLGSLVCLQCLMLKNISAWVAWLGCFSFFWAILSLKFYSEIPGWSCQ